MPRKVRDLIAELRQSHGWTIDQILTALHDLAEGRKLDLPASLPPDLADPPQISTADIPHRSNLAVHIQGLSRAADMLQRTRAVAEAMVRRLGDGPESRAAQLNVELLHSMITDLVLAARPADDDAPPELAAGIDAAQVHFLAKSLDHLTRAARTDAETTLRLRAEAAAAAETRQAAPAPAGPVFDLPGNSR